MASGKYRGVGKRGEAYACFCNKALAQYANRRIGADLARRGFLIGMGTTMLGAMLPEFVRAQGASPAATVPQPVTFTNFRLFDGKSAGLRDGMQLAVEAGRISALGQGQPPAAGTNRTIDCGGRVIMPGLIEMHWHAMLASLPIQTIMQADLGLVYLAASAEAERTLLRGFTTIRDLGGPAFALKQAIDAGMISGPRIYPSGAMITTTGGHGDFRPLTDIPRATGQVSEQERTGANAIADSADEVRLRVREQFLQGATQIKLVGAGGVSTPRSPLDMLTFTEPQLRAAVETAGDWGTYVAVHAYTPAAVKRAVAAGVQCIEHGHLIDEHTAEIMAKKGTWLSTQPFVNEDDVGPLTGPVLDKFREIIVGTSNMYQLARKHGLKVAFGTDLIFSPAVAARQGLMIGNMTRWYSGAEILRMVTGENGALLALSGERNPYPARLGVLEQGAWADLLVVDGNPLDNVALLADPEKNLKLIMKDGRIYKDAMRA